MRGAVRPSLEEIGMAHFYTTMQSPVVLLKLVASDNGLTAVLWEDDHPKRVRRGSQIESPDHAILKRAEQQLREYFAGEREAFDIDLDFVGMEFQRSVWKALLAIPYGETRAPTGRSRMRSATQRRCAPSGPRTAGTRSRSSRPATGS
jgi:methylated-DNA-[protein]-cysteine S-methyltransferase